MMITTRPVFTVTGDTTTDLLLEAELGTRVIMHIQFEAGTPIADHLRFLTAYVIR